MAKTIKILTLADGFGDSSAYPPWYPSYIKWPRILGLMTKGTEIIDLCRYGAGNEYITWCLRQHYQQADMALVQWATPMRLDLVLTHDNDTKRLWLDKISKDPIYHNNILKVGSDPWWISSASTVDWVRQYHKKTISLRQHQIRSIVGIEYCHFLLKNKPHKFMLTPDSDYLSDANIDRSVWAWHSPWKGMHDWRYHSEYKDLDLSLTQPIPLIHFDFIKKFLMSNFDLPWRTAREIDGVESMLLRKYNEYKDKKPK